jgi:iron complex transport system substrate-binding protein
MIPLTLSFGLLLATSAEWLGTPPPKVERVVSLAPSLTETAFALGAGARIVGVTRFDDAPPQVKSLPKVGGLVDPDPEAVLALRPDLALAVPIAGARQRLRTLARLGVPVLVVPAETLNDLWAAINVLGRALGTEAAARSLAASLSAQLAAARARAAGAPRLRVLIIVGYRPLIAAGPGSFLDALLASVNAVNVVARGAAFTHLDVEAAAAGRPDVVLDLGLNESPPPGLWDLLARLQGGKPPRVVHLTDEALVRPGPRLGEALGRLAEALRPSP